VDPHTIESDHSIDSDNRFKCLSPHDQLNRGHGLWDRRTIWCLLHLHRSDYLLELCLSVNNLRPNQASGDSSVCRIKARTFKDPPPIHFLLRRNSYCWRSSLQLIYVVETYAICGTEHLGRIGLFLYGPLPIFQEKEHRVALRWGDAERYTSHERHSEFFHRMEYHRGPWDCICEYNDIELPIQISLRIDNFIDTIVNLSFAVPLPWCRRIWIWPWTKWNSYLLQDWTCPFTLFKSWPWQSIFIDS